jgi:hypothetical protein
MRVRHLSGGVTALTDHQLLLTPEHPPLPRVLAALPVLAEHPVIPHGEAWRRSDSFSYRDVSARALGASGTSARPPVYNR